MKLFAVDEAASECDHATLLYRYISAENQRYFFEGSFSLSRMSAWPDRMECADFSFLKNVTEFEDQRSSRQFFASCWTTDKVSENTLGLGCSATFANEELTKDGSASMWENYCPNGGVRIATTLGKLISLFATSAPANVAVYFGKVNYMAVNDRARFNNLSRIESTFFKKRIGFQHEAEFRFVGNFPNSSENFIPVPISNYYDFLDEILVFPLKDHTLVTLAGELHDFGVGMATGMHIGTNNKDGKPFCRISQLYGMVSQEIGRVEFLKMQE